MSLHWHIIGFFVLGWLDRKMVALWSRVMMRVSMINIILKVEGAHIFDELFLAPYMTVGSIIAVIVHVIIVNGCRNRCICRISIKIAVILFH